MPCYASISADYYSEEMANREEYNQAIEPYVDEIAEDWTVDNLRRQLNPHEQETIDEIISLVAERLLAKETAWHNSP